MGSIYKRPNSPNLWISYYDRNGRQIRESAKSAKMTVARELLKRREGEVAEGRMPSLYFEKVRFKELIADLERDYETNGRKSIARLRLSIENLKSHFGENTRVTSIDSESVRKYIDKRLRQEAAPATINRELSALNRALMLGSRCTPPKVDRGIMPHIGKLRENNTRKGFFEHEDFQKLYAVLPEHLKAPVLFGYRSGWRAGEVRNLQWRQVDRAQGIVTLYVGETKNKEARTIYLDEELKAVFERLWQVRKESGQLLPWVFLDRTGKRQLGDFRKAWSTACKKAEISDKLYHDLRRTAVRNMVRAGIPERVAMQISGHRTRSVFDRYNIVSDADLKLAAQKQAAYLNEVEAKQGGLSTQASTLAHFPPQAGTEIEAGSACQA